MFRILEVGAIFLADKIVNLSSLLLSGSLMYLVRELVLIMTLQHK
jgi:hypothetical protein